ncbi:MAG: adventurous gliding motility lipoprotein CglB, partial [Deltaproteobacteria bacterium]|nr:adventurous gliding motility lipoprotein CglB [Deltaproteobacteria bacterium]
ACQTYDFEPVEPLALAKTNQVKKVVARKSKPNLMLVVDKSGSMKDETPPRISELQRAMVGTSADGFLTSPVTATVGRMGLAVFPTASGSNPCGTGKMIYDIVNAPADEEAALSTASQQIAAFIQGMGPSATNPDQQVSGGTPTAATLALIGSLPSLNTEERDDFILLLTDGLPNCNAGLQGNQCIVCADGSPPPCSPDARSCLDDASAVTQIQSLNSRGVRTIVVGFGSDTAGTLAAPPLNAMAEAGGMPRKCVKPDGSRDPALCGSESCDAATNVCATRFYKSKNASELAAALQQITTLVGAGNPCEYALDSVPSTPELLQVTLAAGTSDAQGNVKWDEPVLQKSSTDYTYADGKVTFIGGTCSRILGATPTKPVNVEFGIIQAL